MNLIEKYGLQKYAKADPNDDDTPREGEDMLDFSIRMLDKEMKEKAERQKASQEAGQELEKISTVTHSSVSNQTGVKQ